MSSGNSANIQILAFPDGLSNVNANCPSRGVNQQKPKSKSSFNLSVPPIISIGKPNLSLLTSTPSMSSSKAASVKSTHIGSTQDLKSTKQKKSVWLPSLTESIVLGAPKQFIGKCQDVETKRLSGKKQFSLTEDPRKRVCLRNPNISKTKPRIADHLEHLQIVELVKNADYLDKPSQSQSTLLSICEVVDLDNPLSLDFLGLDYKNTYRQDEQSCQNQMEYRKVRRFQQRRNVKAETVIGVEREQHKNRIAVPNHFDVNDSESLSKERSFELLEPFRVEKIFGKLVRSEQKPEVRLKIEREDKMRRERYKTMYLYKKKKSQQQDQYAEANQKANIENNVRKLAEKDIQDLVGLLDRTVTTKKRGPREMPERRNFPHTIAETLKFRHQLKKSKRLLSERAKVKKEFYAEIGKRKSMPEAHLKISSDSLSMSPRNDEQSTNDEDDMVVGQDGSKFLLRGFHYKLSSNLRGKFHENELPNGERKVKGCITRSEWFEDLVSKKQITETKIQKDGQGMELFPKILGVKKQFIGSPVKEFRKKPLGLQYDRVLRKNMRIKKPKHIKVKKFNLIGYMYGIELKKKVTPSVISFHECGLAGQTLDYIHNRVKIERIQNRVQKRRRMHYLGIPCPQMELQQTRSICFDSDSGDSEWIPNDGSEEYSNGEHFDRTNMPAPQYRETTLRRHPRRPRDYQQLRVASAEFDDFVKTQGIPVMRKLRHNKMVMENVRAIQNTEYANKFEARHHHDHWNPTQHKTVHIRYSTKIGKLKALEFSKQTNAQLPKTFEKARPRGNDIDNVGFGIPSFKTDEIIKEHAAKVYKKDKSKPQLKDAFHLQTNVLQNMAEDELQTFPGRQKFLNFISEIKSEFKKRGGSIERVPIIDKKSYINELEEDLRSIELCLSSLSSSDCTNLSNDSGSFLLADNKKIPLDYIRKSLVPFVEMNRSRFKAVPIDAAKEVLNPYRTVPFSGQQKEQLSMTAAKENFFTFNSRLQNGLRLRLEVHSEDPCKKLLGTTCGTKANAQVATDIDHPYIEDLNKRPTFKLFKWNSCRTMIKDAQRKKFESMVIQAELVRTKICDRQNEDVFTQMMQTKVLFENLFSKWEKKEYDSAMEVINKVKPYYEATDKYRRESQNIEKQYTVLNMEIVYIENDWMRLTKLQNFHYLLAEMVWRVKHDWIHRNVEGEIEGFNESIVKRDTANIRQRVKDDAWAIKEYYDSIYLKNSHPIIVVFENAKEFLNAIENLKSKTFVFLLELHYTLWILAELGQKYEKFSNWCVFELEVKKTYAENKCSNKFYMASRANQLKSQVDECLDRPVDTFSDKHFSQMIGIINEVYKAIVPTAAQINITAIEEVAAISQVLTDLIGNLEDIPSDSRIIVEEKYRRFLKYWRNMSKQAVFVERRITSEIIKVRSNLGPSLQKPKREGNLPRSELKKMVKTKPLKSVKISEKTKFFYKAFHEEGDLKGLKEARDSLDVMDDIQESIVPFYFDHFLRINGYEPNYNFKTQVELRDGLEVDRFQVKHVLPEVLEKFEKWQVLKRKTMDENINKNPEMYKNVQT